MIRCAVWNLLRPEGGYLNTDDPGAAESGAESLAQRARRLQAAYEDQRRRWAQAVGRPYHGDPDLRPPPGEVDATAED
jgi:hypothetical protein